MNQFEATAIMALLFVLRVALPLALTLLFGLMMNRLMRQSYLQD